MTAWANFLLDHPWAFVLLLFVTVCSVIGVALLGAVLMHEHHQAERSPHADALESLKAMHPGPGSVP